MSNRDYIHPLALAVLDGKRFSYGDHAARGRPLLTPRASAVLAAVEEAMNDCGKCEAWGLCCDNPEYLHGDPPEDIREDKEAMGECCAERMAAIRKAWRNHE